MSSAPSTKNVAVCVTGANGFIGTWLVKTLLQSGYSTIHCSIFPNSSPHLLTLFPSSSLRIFESDILDYDAVSTAIEGCYGVFHVASPCTLEDPRDPQSELVDPAVKGTLNVLEASMKHGVKRVVFTSSISAMVPNPGWDPLLPLDESSWTDLHYCRSRQKWYPVSKTLAEKAAWDFSKKHGLDMVAINPATCLGPLLQSGLNASCAVLQQLLQGSEETQECYWLGAVHVKDVARAHVLLFETPSASGRYLCTNGIFQFGDFAAKVSELFPEYPIHRSISEDSLRRYVYYASENCIQELLSASDSSRNGNGNDGWKILTLDGGMEISKRRSGSFHIFRSRWQLRSVSPQQFISVANAIDAAKQWDADLVEARYIKDLEENLSIIRLRFGDASRPLFKNREFIVYERRETMDDGTLVVAVASLPKEIAAGLYPKQNKAIRGLLLQSGWVVEKLEDDSCMVTYVVQLDPAGWLPKFFVNRLNTKLVMIIDNLKKLAQSNPLDGAI